MSIFNKCNIKMLQKSQEEYKTYVNSSKTIQDLYQNSPTLSTLIELFPSCSLPIEEAFEKKAALQSSILSEYAAFSALGQLCGCTIIVNTSDTINCRCEYHHPSRPIIIKQYGSCEYLDGEIWKDNKLIRRFEVKQKYARCMDNDLWVKPNGELIIPDNLLNEWRDYEPFINSINVWDYVDKGNIQLNNIEMMKKIAHLYLTRYPNTNILVWGDEGLYLLSIEAYFNNCNIKNSEIRPFGKNHRKVYTLDKLKFYIQEKQGVVNNNMVILPKSQVRYVTGLGKTEITRCALNSAFFVFIKDITETEDTVCFMSNKIREKRPNISIHMTFEET